MSAIYSLSDFQFANLYRSANSGPNTFAVLEPLDSDAEEARKIMADELHQIVDLVQMDLLEDVTKEFTEQITVSKMNQNRKYIVVKLTERGFLLFRKKRKTAYVPQEFVFEGQKFSTLGESNGEEKQSSS